MVIISKRFIKANNRPPENIDELSKFLKGIEKQPNSLDQFEGVQYKKRPDGSIKMFFTLKAMPNFEGAIIIKEKSNKIASE